MQEARASASASPQSIVAAAHISESLPVSGSFIKTALVLLAPLGAHKMAASKTPPDERLGNKNVIKSLDSSVV